MLVLHTSFIVAQYIAGARVLEAALGIPYVWGRSELSSHRLRLHCLRGIPGRRLDR